MGNVVTNVEFYDEENQYSTFGFQGTARGIMVGPDGTRFAAEDATRRHGKFNVSGTWQNSPFPDNAWSVFDANGRAQGKLHFTWTDDSQVEIDKGWVVEADTIEALAEKIGVPADALKASIDKWNMFMDGDTIKNIEVLEHSETAGLSDPAFEKLIPEMIEKQSTEIDGITGVTMTSNGLKEAVLNAISKAK